MISGGGVGSSALSRLLPTYLELVEVDIGFGTADGPEAGWWDWGKLSAADAADAAGGGDAGARRRARRRPGGPALKRVLRRAAQAAERRGQQRPDEAAAD
jgi:hypothetical protein